MLVQDLPQKRFPIQTFTDFFAISRLPPKHPCRDAGNLPTPPVEGNVVSQHQPIHNNFVVGIHGFGAELLFNSEHRPKYRMRAFISKRSDLV